MDNLTKRRDPWESCGDCFHKKAGNIVKEDHHEHPDHKGTWESLKFDDNDKEGNDTWE